MLVSALEIINELPNLTADERLSVLRRLRELSEDSKDDPGVSPHHQASDEFREQSSSYGAVDLSTRGIGPKEAADLRARLKAFSEDWERPEASIYDENQTR